VSLPDISFPVVTNFNVAASSAMAVRRESVGNESHEELDPVFSVKAFEVRDIESSCVLCPLLRCRRACLDQMV
jgi:hypothetical protein